MRAEDEDCDSGSFCYVGLNWVLILNRSTLVRSCKHQLGKERKTWNRFKRKAKYKAKFEKSLGGRSCTYQNLQKQKTKHELSSKVLWFERKLKKKKKMGTAHIIKLFPLKEKTKGTQNLHRRKKITSLYGNIHIRICTTK